MTITRIVHRECDDDANHNDVDGAVTNDNVVVL